MKKMLGILAILTIAILYYFNKDALTIDKNVKITSIDSGYKVPHITNKMISKSVLNHEEITQQVLKLEDKCHRELAYKNDDFKNPKIVYENYHFELLNGEVYQLRHFFDKEEKMTLLLENKDQFPLLTKWPIEIINKNFNERLNYFFNKGKLIYKEIGRNFPKAKLYIEEKNDEIIFLQSDDPNNLFECRIN